MHPLTPLIHRVQGAYLTHTYITTPYANQNRQALHYSGPNRLGVLRDALPVLWPLHHPFSAPCA